MKADFHIFFVVGIIGCIFYSMILIHVTKSSLMKNATLVRDIGNNEMELCYARDHKRPDGITHQLQNFHCHKYLKETKQGKVKLKELFE